MVVPIYIAIGGPMAIVNSEKAPKFCFLMISLLGCDRGLLCCAITPRHHRTGLLVQLSSFEP